MATIVDARGKACPQPVIDTKNAIKEQGTPVITMVDNDIARQNVEKMARQMGLNAESSEIDGPPLVIGVAFGNLLQGVPFNVDEYLRLRCV